MNKEIKYKRQAKPSVEIDESVRDFIFYHRVARLATADAAGQPHVVPICYAFDGANIYSPIDEKLRSVERGDVLRLRNIAANPRVSMVIDDYSEDWGSLGYVLINGRGEILDPDEQTVEHRYAVELLREKYSQYRVMQIDDEPMIKIRPVMIKKWPVQS